MGYDDLKNHEGRWYTGMSVGSAHMWRYPDGRWKEVKVAPDRWEFTFEARKERNREAPPESGATIGAQYHWYLLAHQRVRKVDADAYATRMTGVKYKVAHKRPHWRKWSCQYPDQPSERERVAAILEATLARLRKEDVEGVASAGRLPGAALAPGPWRP